jgi:hypothetical protein
MADNDHLDIVKRGVEAWNEWRVKNPKIIPDLTKANLSGFKLAGANFTKTQFNGANLSDTNLRGADLSEANLSTVRFDAIYSRYNSAKESTRRAAEKFKSSSDYESWIDHQESTYGSSIAMQIEYNLDNPQPSEREKTLKNAMLSSKNAQLMDAYLQATLLINSCMIDANLRGANLFGAVLKGADLKSSNFSEAHAIGADFGGANFTGACILPSRSKSIEKDIITKKGRKK